MQLIPTHYKGEASISKRILTKNKKFVTARTKLHTLELQNHLLTVFFMTTDREKYYRWNRHVASTCLVLPSLDSLLFLPTLCLCITLFFFSSIFFRFISLSSHSSTNYSKQTFLPLSPYGKLDHDVISRQALFLLPSCSCSCISFISRR